MGDGKAPDEWMYGATAFELLSLAFLLPTKDTAEALVAGEFADACEEVLVALECESAARDEITSFLSGYGGKDAEEVFHVLRTEYTYLFVGEREPRVTPFIGVWAAHERGQKGLLFVNKESVEIEHFMRDRGVTKNLAAGQVNDPVDHIGTVFEFVKYLCLVNAKAIQAPENVAIEEGDYETFVCEYVSFYARWFADQVFEQARCPFYKAMALFLGQVLELFAPKRSA
ncbi:TorD/DmsD family molecular chaperone [Raoultibacter phocaeensis]|uniref:TorD/DmsD family molecular chaperone n=1 Tax=Raoultibacter phocaeensis TaxID=2479841 RepID=UPI0015D58CF3|nr:molecular chaperone TorD family protein [Raoultibacter phocaeensis]